MRFTKTRANLCIELVENLSRWIFIKIAQKLSDFGFVKCEFYKNVQILLLLRRDHLRILFLWKTFLFTDICISTDIQIFTDSLLLLN